ncbi:hypothetical protein Pcinc_021991 [Petrolisthes cinctipes]|uniref:Uncharacterized protein n=1 Tax=Petrolisthes cinctipes TaxID=88211 RepID=A0AAE1FFJ1_PETCI|nr:hypothetical protein Pcinc_021991 [Petrolisthes cinctipes]
MRTIVYELGAQENIITDEKEVEEGENIVENREKSTRRQFHRTWVEVSNTSHKHTRAPPVLARVPSPYLPHLLVCQVVIHAGPNCTPRSDLAPLGCDLRQFSNV